MQEVDLAAFAVDPRAPDWSDFREHYPRCPECSREVARFADLREALAAEGRAPSGHPSEAQLLALASSRSSLASDERTRLEAHLAGCAPCRTELAVVRDFDLSAVAKAGRQVRWLDRIRGAFVLAIPRPALLAVALAILAIPVGLLLWRGPTQAPPTPVPTTAALEHGAPVEVAEAPAAAPATPSPEAAPAAEPPPALSAAPSVPAREPAPEVAAASPPPHVAQQSPSTAPAPPLTPRPRPIAPAERPSEGPRPVEIAALLPTDAPRYVPGRLAEGPTVRVASAARGLGAATAAPEALAPAHVGVTANDSPDLYWLLPVATSFPVEVTVVDPSAAAPLVETTLPGPIAPGLHRVSLAERGVHLRPGVDYQWFVALVLDPARRSQDVVSGGVIRYAAPGPELGARLSAAPPASAAHVYAASGLWYDAFDQLSTWLATEPDASRLHDYRAALLEQVGLADAAAFERRAAQSQLPISRKGAQ